MSWVCDFCSSNNENDYCDKCFVCGSVRSEESKRRATELLIANKKHLRKVRICATADKIFIVTYKALNIIFALAITLSMSMIIAMFVKLTVNKNLSWIEVNVNYVLNKMANLITTIIQSQIWLMLYEKLTIKLDGIGKSIKEVFNSIRHKVTNSFDYCSDLAQLYLQKIFDIRDNVVSVYEKIISKFCMFIDSFNSVWTLFMSKF